MVPILHVFIYNAYKFIGNTVSGPILRSKALQLYPRIHPDTCEEDFKAGIGWLK